MLVDAAKIDVGLKPRAADHPTQALTKFSVSRPETTFSVILDDQMPLFCLGFGRGGYLPATF